MFKTQPQFETPTSFGFAFDGPGNGRLLPPWSNDRPPRSEGFLCEGVAHFQRQKVAERRPLESQARKASLLAQAMDDLIEKLVNNPKIDDRTVGIVAALALVLFELYVVFKFGNMCACELRSKHSVYSMLPSNRQNAKNRGTKSRAEDMVMAWPSGHSTSIFSTQTSRSPIPSLRPADAFSLFAPL